MTARVGWYGLRLALGVAVALLAGGALAPAPARGGCGDYVVTYPRVHNDRAPDSSRAAHPAPRPRVPCSGPGCSSHQPAVPAAPVAPTSPPGQEWACVPCPPPLPASESFPALLDDPSRRPVHRASTVYHPPR